MAGSTMARDVAAMTLRLAKAVESGSVGTVTTAAAKAVEVQRATIKSVSGGDMKLSNVGAAKGRAGGAAVGASYKVTRKGAFPEVTLKATGPLHLVERDTAGHVIRSAWGKGGGRRSGKSKTFGRLSQAAGPGLSFGGGAINIPGIGFRASARHPGTKGQYPWRNGYQKAQPQIQKIMRSRTFNVVKQGAKP